MTAATPLDVATPPKVTYCIPPWLRDEQVKQNLRRQDVGRIQPSYAPRPEPVAVVGYGPSLNDTWEQVRGYQHVISCSGAHRFLVERGIVPTWHVEVDPRAHKVALIGQPQRDTTYLIASACHPEVFDHLTGHTVHLWHVFDASEDGSRILPPNEWAITGGCDVGLRALTIAAFLGFRDLHVFGMDGSGRDAKHAGEHPNALQHFSPCEYDGVTYQTTPGMLAAAQQVWHELDQMPKVRATFYGEGLIQAMARNYQAKDRPEPKVMANVVGFSKPELISSGYRDLNAQLHRENLAFGVGGGKHAPTILKLSERLKTTSVLDYGCGKGYLAKAIPFPIWEYDPAVPGKDEAPRSADIVACLDVLEHVEPERILFVLDDLRRCTKKVGYFVIHTGPSSKSLADGRNAHILQRDRSWWQRMLGKFFKIGQVIEQGPLLHVVVGPRTKAKAAAA